MLLSSQWVAKAREANVHNGSEADIWAAAQFVHRKHVLLGPSTIASVGRGDFLHIRCDLPVYSSQKVFAWS
jgi:hypothetical protein